VGNDPRAGGRASRASVRGGKKVPPYMIEHLCYGIRDTRIELTMDFFPTFLLSIFVFV